MLRIEDMKVGMKVIPIDKSYGYNNLQEWLEENDGDDAVKYFHENGYLTIDEYNNGWNDERVTIKGWFFYPKDLIEYESEKRGFETVVDNHRKQDTFKMPLRATKTSAGYDFYTPIDISIPPQGKVLIWTDIKAYMPQGEFLMLDVTSGIGTKKDCMLANTIGIADADYYSCEDNDGNLGICLRNLKPQFELDGYTNIETKTYGEDLIGRENQIVSVPNIIDLTQENTVVFLSGEKIAQGIFVKYETADNCNGEEIRKGGFGSTDKAQSNV